MTDLTDEQIELDILMYLEDHPEHKKSDTFTDTEYDQALKDDLDGGDDSSIEESPPPPPDDVEDWEDAPLEDEE